MNICSSVERPVQVSPGHIYRAAMLMLVLALPLSACGPSEPQQRQTFIDFLKARIVNIPGIRLPVPTDEERKSWGPYAAHYNVIVDGYHAIDRSTRAALEEINSLNAGVRLIGSLIGKRDEVVRVRNGAEGLPSTLKRQLEIAGAARAALPPQPDDLKPVYDAAYERTVSGFAAIWMSTAPALQRTLTSYLDMLDFLEQHKNGVTVNGAMITPNDPKLVPQLTSLMKAIEQTLAASNAEITRSHTLIHGGKG
jgi:hypothetical protein